MKAIFVILVLIFTLHFQSFSQSEVLSGNISEETLSTLMITCYVCHNPRIKNEKDIIAPPLVAVKYRYKTRYPEKSAFVDAITDFVMEPTNQKALMQGPVMQFGVMPDMPLNESQVRSIAAYIYEQKIEEPAWFPAHFQAQHGIEWKGQ